MGSSPGYFPEVTEAIRYEDSAHVGVDRIRAVGRRSILWNAVSFVLQSGTFGREAMGH
jgi:hypothetical protein